MAVPCRDSSRRIKGKAELAQVSIMQLTIPVLALCPPTVRAKLLVRLCRTQAMCEGVFRINVNGLLFP